MSNVIVNKTKALQFISAEPFVQKFLERSTFRSASEAMSPRGYFFQKVPPRYITYSIILSLKQLRIPLGCGTKLFSAAHVLGTVCTAAPPHFFLKSRIHL